MRRIRFTSEQTYETDGPGKGPVFPEGLELDAVDVGKVLGRSDVTEAFALAFLRRWVQRGHAEYVVAEEPAPLASDPALHSETDDGLDKLTRGELDDLARDRGVDISAAKNKGDVIAALRKMMTPTE